MVPIDPNASPDPRAWTELRNIGWLGWHPSWSARPHLIKVIMERSSFLELNAKKA